jgi:acetylglutamate kinase
METMDRYIPKAQALIEALKYIQLFDEKIVVVKLGGSCMEDRTARRSMLTDVAFMSAVGIRPVLVHGGGPAINEAMKKAGLTPNFVRGLRFTDERTLDIAEDVLVNQINSDIVDILREVGEDPLPLHSQGSCAVFAERKTPVIGGEPTDIGLVGRTVSVNADLIRAACASEMIPVIAPVARAIKGPGRFNVNADEVAGDLAAALRPAKLVMLSDTHGVRRNPADPASLARTLTESEIREMIASGAIDKGMLPKVEACLAALAAGVSKTHIIDGGIPHALLLEIYTDAGVGTEIVRVR